ncbi:MAG: ATP-binding protein [Mobilicoccus sp.]|nr:ATP-binding protein [Mobilicoccus sp.]
MQPSPYTPGETARQVPGREAQMDEIGGLLLRVAQEGRLAGRIRVDVGPRGVGKTSLLRRAQRAADDLGLATVFVTAGNGALPAVIGDELGASARGWDRASRLADRIERVTLTAGVPGVAQVEVASHRSAEPQATRAFRELVIEAADAARANQHRGIVLLVDEVQAADATDLRTIAYAWQELQSGEPVPAALLTAGLSHAPDVITNAVPSGERFAFRPLRDLEPHQAREALTVASSTLGVRWETSAIQAVVERAQGYPYFVQLYGDEVWRAAGSPDAGGVLRSVDVDLAQERVDVDLDALYRTRWFKATPRERDILIAMAEATTPLVPRGDIADRLGVASSALSMARQSLLDKGIVDAPDHGLLTFTVPGFARFVRARATG